MERPDRLLLKSGKHVHRYNFRERHLLDKLCLLIGPSNSGKTVIIKDFLHILKDKIPMVYLVAPEARNNEDFDGIIPPALTHYSITVKDLEKLWARQTIAAQNYRMVSNPEILKELSDMRPNADVRRKISKLRATREKLERDVHANAELRAGQRENYLDEIQRRIEEATVSVYKAAIVKDIDWFKDNSDKFSEDQRRTVKFIMYNPRMLIILDDCTSMFSRLQKSEVFQKLFYQGRHVFVTVLITAHADKKINTELRTNAFITILTKSETVSTYFAKKVSCGFSDAQVSAALEAAQAVFRGDPKTNFKKLVSVRGSNELYFYEASVHPRFAFGSKYMQDFCENIKTSTNRIDSSNPFSKSFKV